MRSAGTSFGAREKRGWGECSRRTSAGRSGQPPVDRRASASAPPRPAWAVLSPWLPDVADSAAERSLHRYESVTIGTRVCQRALTSNDSTRVASCATMPMTVVPVSHRLRMQ